MKLSAACAVIIGTVALDIGSTISATEAAKASTVFLTEEDNDTEATAVAATSTKKPKKNGGHHTPAATTSSSALGVQDGRICSIEKDAKGTYTLRATLGNETVLFLERPNRGATTVSTRTFVDNFEKVFASSSPNVAITFTGDKASSSSSSSSSSASLDGPLIVILSRPSIIGGLDDGSSTLDVEYTMEQSASQSTVATMEQFVDASGSCSIFIDFLASPLYFP